MHAGAFVVGLDPLDPSVNAATAVGDLVAARARLSAAAGGLGITSAVATSQHAFLGSLCLTAHLVKSALGATVPDEAAVAAALPDLAAAVSANAFAAVPSLASATLTDLVTAPFVHAQRKLARATGKAAADAVLRRIADPAAAAWFLSGQEDGATFLIAYPEFGGGINDLQFTTLVKARLGLRIVPALEQPEQCPACSGHKSGTGILDPKNTTLRPDGLHALHCHESGRGGLMGFTSSRHAHLKFTVIEVLQRFLPKTAEVAKVEPSSSTYYPFKNDKNTDIRNDIAVTIDGVTTLCDTVVSHPNPVVQPLVATVAGTAAQLAFQQKQTMYNNTFVIPTGHMVPLSAETGGRLHADFKGFVKRCVARGLADAGSRETEWTDATRVLFSSRMRSALVTINIAIARSVSSALIRGSTVLARYGALHTGPLGAAPAAAPAGGG